MSLRNELPTLSAAQLEVMEVIWEKAECSVTDVWEVLRARRRVARNTVLTVITRLDEKGWLKRRPEGNGFLYRATATRETTQKQMVGELVATIFKGSAEGLVLTLLNETLPTDEANRIRSIIAKAKGRKK